MCALANHLFSVVFVVLAPDPGNSDLFPFEAWSPPKITGPSGRKNSQQKCEAGITDMARMVTCGSILKALLLLPPSPSLGSNVEAHSSGPPVHFSGGGEGLQAAGDLVT